MDPSVSVSCQGALEELFQHAPAIQKYKDSFLYPFWEEYAQNLLTQGYARETLRYILNANFRFYIFLERIKVNQINGITRCHYQRFLAQSAQDFNEHCKRQAPQHYINNLERCVGGFLEYVFKKAGLIFAPSKIPQTSRTVSEKILQGYEQFCRSHQGLKESTLKDYRWWLARLGSFFDKRKIAQIAEVALTDLDSFVWESAPKLNRRSRQHLIGILRSFFKYLFLQRIIPVNLADRLVYPRVFQGELRPKYVPWADIQKLLAGINQKTAGGQRNYAILVLMASYGLRGREVTALRLEDMDWQDKRLILKQRKGGRMAVFPLTQEVELALKNYIERGRPKTERPEVFMTTKAPIRPMGSGALTQAIQKHLHQLGPNLPSYGGYVIRHSFAKALLDRGADLFTIKHLLGHQCLQTTLIYTRIATLELREVADNYARLL